MEIVNIMQENISSSFEISKHLYNLKEKLYNQFINNIESYCNANNMVCNIESGNKEYGIYIKPKSWKENKNKICIVFENGNFNGLFYGISNEDGISNEEKMAMREKFKKQNFQENEWWIWQSPNEKDWGDNAEIWVDIAEGTNSKIFKNIIEKIDNIIEIEKS